MIDRRARARAGSQGGFTALEVTVSTALLLTGVVIAMGLLSTGARAQRRSLAREEAVRMGARLLDAIASELKDARVSSVVISTTEPDSVQLRRVTGYDPTGLTDETRCLLSPPIVLRRVPFAVPGHPGLHAVERVEGAGAPRRIGAYVADRDASDASRPGLCFELREAGDRDDDDGGDSDDDGGEGGHPRGTTLDVTLTVAVPGGADGPAVVRLVRTVHLEVE